MRVSVAFGSRGHAYSLARHLGRQSLLQRAYTFCPAQIIAPDIRHAVRTFPYLHLAMALLSRAGFGKTAKAMNLPVLDLFDKWVAARIEPGEVFMAMSGLGLYARRAAKKQGAKTVCDRGSTHIQVQDALLEEEFRLWSVPYQPIPRRLIDKEVAEYEEADLVVAQSSFAYQSFRAKGLPEAKLAWISPGVDLETFAPKQRKDDVFRVLFLGQIGLRKGIQYLLQAMSAIRAPKVELVIAGSLMDETKAILGRYEGTFRYVGRPVTKGDLRDLYCQASLFVLPTIEDGFGLVINEAMACGVPVIATTNSGGPDLIHDGVTGFVVPIRSPEALAERISFLAQRPQLSAEMGRQARSAIRNYEWTRYGERVVALYEKTFQRTPKNQ